MRSFISSCTKSYRNWSVERRQSKITKYYENKKYLQIPQLIRDRRDYEEITIDGYPFPYFLLGQNNKEALEIFMKNISFKDDLPLDDNNPLKMNLLMFAYLQNKQQLAQFLQSSGFQIGVMNTESQNLLHLATIYRRKEAFMNGLKKKVNHDVADVFGNTPLHYACRGGEVDLVEALIAGKAKKIENKDHLYPIHMAIQSQSKQAVQLLRDDLWLKYPLFHPFHSAARVGFRQIMKDLLQRDPTLINVRDYKRLTPLHHAVATQNSQSISFLLKQSEILLDVPDQYGNTPLHIAFMRDDIESASKLIEAKANPDILNHDYLAPVDLGLDSSSQITKNYIKSIVSKSKRLQEYNSDE